MEFKKDYINFIFKALLFKNHEVLRNKEQLRTLFEKIINENDLAKITFVIGKTAGLEILFKYLLYISDKIDKSQITIFNIKENSDYDVKNLIKICSNIQIPELSKQITAEEEAAIETEISSEADIVLEETKEDAIAETETSVIPEETFDEIIEKEEEESEINELSDSDEFSEEPVSETEEKPAEENMMLIENEDTELNEDELYKISRITADDNEVEDILNEEEYKEVNDDNEEVGTDEEKKIEEKEVVEEKVIEEVKEETEELISDTKPEVTELKLPEKEAEKFAEVKINKPSKHEGTEESAEDEAYYRFEEKFFIESKILEKQFQNILREHKKFPIVHLNEFITNSCREIIGISTGLSNITRKLSLDLTADILMTIGLYFTRVLKYPYILTRERVHVMQDSMKLIAALVKNENYLNYDKVIDKLEEIKNELMAKPPEPPVPAVKEKKTEPGKKIQTTQPEITSKSGTQDDLVRSFAVKKKEEQADLLMSKDIPVKQTSEITGKSGDTETIIFKMKYLVREFEKSFDALDKITGEYSKFEALDRIDELNNYLRLVAKFASSVSYMDVVKLSEVTYVFLKYIKDYRMNIMEPEVKQIIKYVIFCFKMLLTNRKPEDLNILVDHLNNPVKIFTDT